MPIPSLVPSGAGSPADPPVLNPGGGGFSPGSPPSLIAGGGTPNPGEVPSLQPTPPSPVPAPPPSVVPDLPAPTPAVPPSRVPATPVPPIPGFDPSTKADKARTITGGGLATGGGDLSQNRVITVTAASQAQAEAGTAASVVMTPQRSAQHLAAWWATLTTAVKTTGNQAISGLKTFATSPRSTGTPDSDTSILNRKQAELRRFPFLRPTEANQWRQVLENFAGGSLVSPTIGNWNWSANLDGGTLTEDSSSVFSGRGLALRTAAVTGSRATVYRFTGGSTASDQTAVTFLLRNLFLVDPASVLNAGELWVGWRDSNLHTGSVGRFQVGWSWAESNNILIKQQGSDGAALVVTDTGIPIPNNIDWAGPTLNITLIGQAVASYFGGTAGKRRVIIAGPQPINTQVILDTEVPQGGSIYNDRLFMEVRTNANAVRSVILQGVELYHEGPHHGRVG